MKEPRRLLAQNKDGQIVTIDVYGIDDDDAPLIICATCQQCGLQLSSNAYSKEEYQHQAASVLQQRVNQDAANAAMLARGHRCTTN